MTKEHLNAGCLREAYAARARAILLLPPPLYRPNNLRSIVITQQSNNPLHQHIDHVRPISVPSVRPSNSHCFALHHPLTPGQCFQPPAMPRRTRHQSRELLKKFLGQRI